jgi:hypothetical protein
LLSDDDARVKSATEGNESGDDDEIENVGFFVMVD